MVIQFKSPDIYKIAMNNPRGTYINKTKTNAHMTSAHPEQRTTIINTSVSKQGEVKNTQAEQEKRITRILDVASKLENPTNTPALSRETLKTGSTKAFFDVLCIFLRAIDGHTERADFSSSSTNTQLLQDALKFFGYKGNCNKSLFQPIGAPHTWKECLAILEWFSELAAYAFNFQSVLQQNVFEEDMNSLILKSFKSKNDEMFSSFIHRRVEHLEAEIANNTYTIESKQMAINNLHAGQKELAQVMKDLQKEKQLAYRAKQEAIAAEADAKSVEVKIQAKQAQLSQARQKVREGDLALQKIRYQIVHQELPPEQCEKLKLQIRDTKNKINEIEQSISENLDIQKSLNKQYLQKFTDLASHLRKMADKLHGMSLVHHSDVPLSLPTVNPLELGQFLRSSFQHSKLDLQDQAKLEAIFKEREFAVFFRKQDEFVAKCQAKFTKEEEELLRQEQEIQATDAKCKDLQEFIDKLERSKKEKDVRSTALQAEKNELIREIAVLEGDIEIASQELSIKTIQKEGLIKEVKEALNDLKETEEMSKENERRRKEITQLLRDRLEHQKKVSLEKIENYKKALSAIFNSKLRVNQNQQ